MTREQRIYAMAKTLAQAMRPGAARAVKYAAFGRCGSTTLRRLAEVALDAADATRGQVTAVGMGEMFRIINGALMGDTAKVRNYTDKTQLGREEVLYGPPPAPPAPLPRPTLRFSQTSLRTRATRSTPSGSEPY